MSPGISPLPQPPIRVPQEQSFSQARTAVQWDICVLVTRLGTGHVVVNNKGMDPALWSSLTN